MKTLARLTLLFLASVLLVTIVLGIVGTSIFKVQLSVSLPLTAIVFVSVVFFWTKVLQQEL